MSSGWQRASALNASGPTCHAVLRDIPRTLRLDSAACHIPAAFARLLGPSLPILRGRLWNQFCSQRAKGACKREGLAVRTGFAWFSDGN